VHVNATLNAIAAMLLLIGFYLIKTGRVETHKRTMLAAFAVSVVFLACYLWYHSKVGHVVFTHSGFVRVIYLAVLWTHIPLAFTVPFLAIRQIYLGYRALGCCSREMPDADRIAAAATYRNKHIRLARWTFPIWMYVSVTGVIIYLMLYQLF
ncbi:MAG: DUF420 domain-containing protein, partial [Acidobacteria bacterium]